MRTAITRQVSPRFAECELTYIDRHPIDLELARSQQDNYHSALEALGCHVIVLPAEPDLPDSVFVEDTAVILPECAIVTIPGAPSRRAEVTTITAALAPFRKIESIQPPATMDGGDVLLVGNMIFIGLSTRTNAQAIEQVKALLTGKGYAIEPVEFHGCLHLKSAASRLDDHTLLLNPDWVDPGRFNNNNFIVIDRNEPLAANCLPIGETILYSSDYPKTAAKIRSKGYQVQDLEFSEFAKAEGALTCCSLIIQ